MRNFVCLIAVCLVAGCAVAEIVDILNLNEQEMAQHRRLLDACYIVTDTNRTQINELEKNLDNACPQNLGCLLACYSQAVKILKSNGRVDMTPLKRNMSPENYKIAEACWNRAPVVGDLCYQTFETYVCFATNILNQQDQGSQPVVQLRPNVQIPPIRQYQQIPKIQQYQPVQLVPYFGYY